MKRYKCRKCHTILLKIFIAPGGTNTHLNDLYYCRFCNELIKIIDDKTKKRVEHRILTILAVENQHEPGIKIKEKIICMNCHEEIEYDDILGYYCDCGQYIKINIRKIIS